MSPRRPGRLPLRPDPARHRGPIQRAVPAVVVAGVVFAASLAGFAGVAAAAEYPTVWIEPATQEVAAGQEFAIDVIHNASIPTTGVQLDVWFDEAALELRNFELGETYTGASAIFAFGNADLGTSGNKDAAIAQANETGVLENVAGFLLPGSGTIPTGDVVFLRLSFAARDDATGPQQLRLRRGSMLDEAGAPLRLRHVHGEIVVRPGVPSGGSPSPSGSPGPSGSSRPSDAPTEPPPAPVNPTTPVQVALAPASVTLKAGNTVRVFLVANADGSISSVASDLTFDPENLEIIALEPGPAWSAATVVASSSGGGLDAAIAEANASGVLLQAGAFYPPGTEQLPDGEGIFLSALMQAKIDGESSLSISNAVALGVSGEELPTSIDPGSATRAPDRGLELDPTLMVPLGLLALLVVGGVVLVRSDRVPVRVRRRWPYYASLALGLVPVAAFGVIVVTLVANSVPVLSYPGVAALFGAEYLDFRGLPVAGFDIVSPVWGTVLIAVMAAVVALPVSLAMAVAAVDFPLGPISRVIRPLVGLLSGIPPIIYAVSVPVFITALMIPKFAANANFSSFSPDLIGADPATWPPSDVPYSPGGFPWDLTGVANSTLLGGLLVGLFLIPFVTPLFVDALRDVPRAAREASLALGANQTYTLRRVVLPRAMPAIAGASTLGLLKAMGDVLIVAFAVGWASRVPVPPFDVLERTAPISASGALLIGSFDVLDTACQPAQCAVGYTSALALLLVAAVGVLAMTWLQVRGRRRVAV